MFYWVLGAMTALIVVLDQVTKYLVSANMTVGQTVPAISWLFDIHYVRNSGMAWSMFSGARWIFVTLTVIILVAAVIAIKKKWISGKVQLISIGMIMGGAIGNMIDRIVTGQVVDMIRVTFMNFPVFNVADCFISCGAVLLALEILFGDMLRKKKHAGINEAKPKKIEEKNNDLDT